MMQFVKLTGAVLVALVVYDLAIKKMIPGAKA